MCDRCDLNLYAADVNHQKYLEECQKVETLLAVIDDVKVIAGQMNDVEWYQARGLLAKIVARVGGKIPTP